MKSLFKLSFILYALIILCSCNGNKTNTNVNEIRKYKIVGYVAGWSDCSKMNIEAEKLTHINYAFASISKIGALNEPQKSDSDNFIFLNSLKKRNEDLKIIISIGGWGSEYFSNAALNDTSRILFAKSAVAFMKKFNLDGIDIDWEYPGQTGGGNIFRNEDKENFTLMLKVLREQLDIQGKKDDRAIDNKYLLTIATGADKEYMKHTELGKAHQYLDFINIMTYDLYNGLDKETGHHTGLYQSKKGTQARNTSADAVKGHIDAGVPASKIVLGLPFYGRGWNKVADKDNGLFQPAEGEHFSLSYDSLKAAFINKNDFVRYWDDDAKTPYLWNAKSKTFITYADEESFTHKTDFVRSSGLGGVMFWEYSHDSKNELINKLYTGLSK